jgi:phage terminase small subunit
MANPAANAVKKKPAKKAAVAAVRKSKAVAAGLNPSQVQVLCSLIQGKTHAQAAQAGACSVDGVKYMLGIPEFRAALEKAMVGLQQRARIDADGLIEALIPAATVDIRQFFTADDQFIPMANWTPEMGRAVSSIEWDEIWGGEGEDRKVIGRMAKIKFWPKVEAVDKLAKLLGAYQAKKHTHMVGVVVVPAKQPAPEGPAPIDSTFRRNIPAKVPAP